jgi:hypothetical protein
MALRGEAAVVIWGETGDAEVGLWWAREHLPERLSIPGFLRGRRCVRETGTPTSFMMYELSDTSVLTAPQYLARLNNPTARTKEIMAKSRGGTRVLCKVAASRGLGVGAYVLTARMELLDGPGSELSNWMARSAPSIAEQPGITGAHLLLRDMSIAKPDTKERQLRQHADQSSDVIVVIEGYDRNAVAAVAEHFPAIVKSLVLIDLFHLAQVANAEDAGISAQLDPIMQIAG